MSVLTQIDSRPTKQAPWLPASMQAAETQHASAVEAQRAICPIATQKEIQAAVLGYAQAGWHPIELAACNAVGVKSPGKQPTNNGWQREAKPQHPSTYSPTANVGLRMGRQPDGTFVIAVDVDDPTSIHELATDWPATLVNETRPGERYQLLYYWPTDLSLPKNAVKAKTPTGKIPVDIRSEGGQIAVWPSTHPTTGKQYCWVNQGDLATLPTETAQAILRSQSLGASSARVSVVPKSRVSSQEAVPRPLAGAQTLESEELEDDPAHTGADRFPCSQTLFLQACKRLSRKAISVAPAFELLARNLAFAEPGCRDDTIWKMCWHLSAELPRATGESIQKFFETSLSAMHAISPFDAPADVAVKFDRAINKRRELAAQGIQLLQTSTGVPIATVENILRILAQDPEIAGKIGYDSFASRIMWRAPAPWHKPGQTYPTQYTDRDSTSFSAWLMKQYRLHVKSSLAFEAAVAASHDHKYHPVQDYFLDLRWDGVPRLDTWMHRHLGCEDNEYTRKVSAWWMMQAVSRIARPGCQADYTLIFEGQQGRGKTQTLRALASPEWFLGNLSAITNKDAMVEISGKWIVELAELTAFRSEINATKSFLTRSEDHYRAPYGKIAETYPRQCVFAGSTNDFEYLQDQTGNRRFWPIRVGDSRIDRDAIVDERDQLWAEAAYRLAAGEKPYPTTDAEEEMFAEEVEDRRLRDPWEGRLETWCKNPTGLPEDRRLSSSWILTNVLDVGLGKRGDDARLSSVLYLMKWRRDRTGAWSPPESVIRSAGVPKPRHAVRGLAPVVPLRR